MFFISRFLFVSLHFQVFPLMKKILRIILLIINLLVAAALILSTMAGVIEPSRMAFVSILSYGFFLFLMANVVFVIIWLFLSRWEFLVSVAAIAVRFSFVPLFFQVGGTLDVEPAENTLKVMTLNTHAFKGVDSDTLMRADSGATLFLKMIDQEQPDVMCLQEFFRPRRMSIVDSLEARGYTYHYGVHGKNTRSQSILFSRCKMLKGYDMDRKSKFYADIEKNGKTVRVCCVHLDSYQLDEDDLESFENLSHAKTDSSTHRLMKKFAETTRQHEREWKEELKPLVEESQVPLIIAGDFNDTPASYIYQQATDLLSDPYVEQGRGFGTTYHGPYPAFRIDYILHSHDLEALSYKRIPSPISDHYPIVVTLKIS